MRDIFEGDDTDTVLYIDTSNAFNVLNRATALHNIRVLCPIVATYATTPLHHRRQRNYFRQGYDARGPLAMAIYALSMQP